MNRFKPVIPETKSGDYSKRKQEVQLLNILDKCTQVLRDDRIWFRNKVKECDPDVIQIFKKYLSKRPSDLSSLQVSLRKHIMKIKDKTKKQQLQKFKQNLNAVAHNSLFDRQNAPYQRNSKSTQLRKPKQHVHFEDEQNQYQQYVPKHNSKPKYQHQPLQNYNKKGNPLSSMRMTDPIQEQQNEQGYSYRSQSQINKNRPSYHKQYQKQSNDRFCLPWQKLTNNFIQKQKQIFPEFKDNKINSIQQQFNKISQIMKKPQDKNIRIPQNIYQIQQSNVEQNSPVSQCDSSNRKSLHYQSNHLSSEKKKDFNNLYSFKPSNFSETFGTNSRQQVIKNHTPEIEITNSGFLDNVTSSNNDIFTDPQLLNECRKFIRNSQSKIQQICPNPVQSIVCSFDPTSQSAKLFTNTNSLSARAKDCNSQTKVLNTDKSVSSQKLQNNPLSHRVVVQQFQKQYPPNSQLIQDISKLYAEQVFDIVFSTNNSQISLHEFQKIVNQNFVQTEKLMKLFKLANKTMTNTIFATDFGRLLLTNCNYKPNPNPVKQIFSLIDIDRKGYFTLDDYERFLEQVIDPQDPASDKIINVCELLFQQADITKSQRVQYWGLYLTRKSEQFEQFNQFLQQFEFEVETTE